MALIWDIKRSVRFQDTSEKFKDPSSGICGGREIDGADGGHF